MTILLVAVVTTVLMAIFLAMAVTPMVSEAATPQTSRHRVIPVVPSGERQNAGHGAQAA